MAVVRPACESRRRIHEDFMPRRERYHIKSPTIALLFEQGRHVARLLPVGAVILVDPTTLDGDDLVEASWGEKEVKMFTEDVRTNAQKAS